MADFVKAAMMIEILKEEFMAPMNIKFFAFADIITKFVPKWK